MNSDKTLTIRISSEDIDLINNLIDFYKKQNINLSKTALIKKLIKDAVDNTKK